MNWQDIKNIIKEELKEATTVTADNTKFNLRTGVNKNPTKLGIKIQFEPKGEGSLGPEAKSKLEVALQEKLNSSLKEYDIQISKDTDVPRADVIGFFIPLAQLKNLIVKSLTGKSTSASVQAPEPEGEELNESSGVIDKIAGGIPYRYEGDGRTGQAIISEPLDDDTKTRIIKRAKQAGYTAKPNMAGGVTIIITGKERKLNEGILNEMRVRDLNEISKIVMKEDFYAFINAGNNVLRSLEESGRSVSEAKKYLGYLVKHNIM